MNDRSRPIKGLRAFSKFVGHQTWLSQPNASIEDLVPVIRAGRRACGEVILHFEGGTGRASLPAAIVADKEQGGQIDELRMYYSSQPLTGRHANRPPLMQPDPELSWSGVVAEHQRALSAGDLERSWRLRAGRLPPRACGGDRVHRGADALHAFYERLFANGGGIPLEQCTVIDDEHTCVLEYNVVRWGDVAPPPQAGVGVYVRGQSGKIAAARIYDDVDPRGEVTGRPRPRPRRRGRLMRDQTGSEISCPSNATVRSRPPRLAA